MAGPDYQRDNTVIIITWDESGGGATQAEIVISPSTHGIKTTRALDHYARPRALEDLFSLPYFGNAATAATNYRSSFGL